MPGILSSCCPFLTNAATEGVAGSPPYSMDMRLRIHNWANSLTGSREVPRAVAASSKEKPGLPDFSRESSATSVQKSEISLQSGSDEGECTVIFAPPAEFSNEDAAHTVSIVSESMVESSDWETDNGQEEEEVSLLEKIQPVDEEGDGMRLERKEAKMTLPPKLQDCELPVPYKAPLKIATLPKTIERLPEFSQFKPLPKSSSAPQSNLPPEASTKPPSENRNSDNETLPYDSPKMYSTLPHIKAPGEEPRQACSSSELMDAISSLPVSVQRGSKSRRSRMTSTRAPTPWSGAHEQDELSGAESEGTTAELQPLEPISSSSGSSFDFESTVATADSSFHTLPSATSSAERAGGSKAAQSVTATQEQEVWVKVADETCTGAEKELMKGGGEVAFKIAEKAADEEKSEMFDAKKITHLKLEEMVGHQATHDLKKRELASLGKVKEAIQSWETADAVAHVDVTAHPKPWTTSVLAAAADIKDKAQAWKTAVIAAIEDANGDTQELKKALEAVEKAEPGKITETVQTWEAAELEDEMNNTTLTWETADLAAPEDTKDAAQRPDTAGVATAEEAEDPQQQRDPEQRESPQTRWETAELTGPEETEGSEEEEPEWEAAELALPWEVAAGGDHQPPPATAGPDDQVSLRYFCGAFRPDDHVMARHAGLEQPVPAALPAGLSDSAMAGSVERRAARPDSTLPPPDERGSGVTLQAKPADMALSVQEDMSPRE